MQTWLTPSFLLAALGGLPASSAIVVDRIAVIVGKHVIKTSDLDRDLRLTAFLNRQQIDLTTQSKRQAAERLIDQELIRQELVMGSYHRPMETEADAIDTQLVHDRFGGSEAALRQSLERYGLTQEQLRAALLWQITVLRFIDQRFRAGVFVADDQVTQYFQQHEAELRKESPGAGTPALQSKAREILEGEQVNRNFTAWLDETRKQTRLEYKQEAFL